MCKRLKRIADYYIKTNFPAVGTFDIYQSTWDMISQMDDSSIGLIKSLQIRVNNDSQVAQLDTVKNVLSRVQSICILQCELSERMQARFYIFIREHCTSLKDLFIYASVAPDSLLAHDVEWYLGWQYGQNPPSVLERISFCFLDSCKNRISNLRKFFGRNPNIHTVSFSSEILEEYGPALYKSGMKFQQLIIGSDIKYEDGFNESSFVLLTKLHKCGFYKTLHLYIAVFDLLYSGDDLSILNLPGLEKLRIVYLSSLSFSMPSIRGLKELSIDRYEARVDFENVKSIERLHIDQHDHSEIGKIIQDFPMLKYLKINDCQQNETNTPLDLVALNKERKKLTGACKITIYVDEKTYFATKCATRKMDLEFVELKRGQTYNMDCNRSFNF